MGRRGIVKSLLKHVNNSTININCTWGWEKMDKTQNINLIQHNIPKYHTIIIASTVLH